MPVIFQDCNDINDICPEITVTFMLKDPITLSTINKAQAHKFLQPDQCFE